MSRENVETFKRAADAYNRRDVEALLRELDPEHHPGLLFMFLSNRVHDERQIREMLREQAVEELEDLGGFADTA